MSPTAPAPTTPGTLHPVPDAVAYLTGRWTVHRVLRDLATGQEGTFTGTAVFRPAAGATHLLHVEDGGLTWNGTTGRAGRTLLLYGRPDGTADVRFADGRPFHPLDLRSGHWTTRHPCGRDRYDGTFTVVSADEWRLAWRTTGPAKDQLQHSVYRRAESP
ncbi:MULTISPECIES: DUF6314 family protein [Streptomyces]|uniref:DUF6314 family protein n=1 Tax=Streptomyces TaxID=1883 RepID=UPI00163C7254|nr:MULTISPECIES: DUF6314 family protein [Streptomyces]MBC2876995.1 hypothetical protein [Streptomyces sp. TYQ1024]UBI36019.1 DUF6314 family protein [Streptomyces mobaraensis]UKW28612.1 DUF6314 family protein [Streptomyces sp. TYQ1024]